MTGSAGRVYVQHAEAVEGSIVVQVAGDLYVSDEGLAALWTDETVPGECPYPGLDAFGPSQAKWFFGRELPTGDLLDLLDASLRAGLGGPVIVVGPSGAGKSSLLRAGLLKALQDGRLAAAGPDAWPILTITPGSMPMATLTTAISTCTEALSGLRANPGDSPAAWDPVFAALRTALCTASTDQAPQRVIVVVDQLEELFTPDCDDAGRQAFLGALAALTAPGPDGPAGLVVFGMRADFYSRATEYPVLRTALQLRPLVLAAMSPAEVTQAITQPARATGLRLQGGLAERLMRDLGVSADERAYEAGRLPLLAYALRATWQRRDGGRLTIRGYEATGGIGGAIAKAAEDVYIRLDTGGQRTAQQLFLALIQVGSNEPTGEGMPDTRRRLGRERLCSLTSDPVMASEVLDLFIAARLITSGGQTVEISHDALMSRWPRLQEWISQDRSGHLIHQSLEEAAEAWDHERRDPAALYGGIRLAAALQWADNPGRPRNLSLVARAFLAASGRRRRRDVRRRNGIIVILAALSAGLTALTVYAFNQRAAADQQRDQARFSQVAAEALQAGASNIPLAAQLTLAAYRMQSTRDLASRLLATENIPLSRPFGGGGGNVHSVAFSPDGRTLVSLNDNGTFRLWDVADKVHSRPLSQPLTGGHGNAADAVAVSPHGHILASGDTDGTIQLWDITDPAHPRKLGRPLANSSRGNSVNGVTFSPDGRTLASSNIGGAVWLWDVAAPAHPRLLSQLQASSSGSTVSVVTAMAFSSNSHMLASSSNNGDNIQLWDITRPANPQPLGPPLTSTRYYLKSNRAWGVAFSPDSRTLASSNIDGTIQLWDITDPAHPQSLSQLLTSTKYNLAETVAFSPDGHILASGNNDGTISLWDVADPSHPLSLGQPVTTGSDDSVYAVAFSPDGRTLASGYRGGTIRLWSLPRTVLTSAGGGILTVAFSPDSHTLASGTDDGTIQLWDVADLAHPRPLGQTLISSSGNATVVTFSHDSRMLAGGNSDGRIRLWEVTDPAHPRPLGQTPVTGTGVYEMAFSPDGRTLASVSSDGRIRLWEVTDPAHPRPLGQPLTFSGSNGSVEAVEFSPDGRILVGSGDGRIRLWNVVNPVHPQPLGQHLLNGGGIAMAFSPDGRTLASSGSNGVTVLLWNITDPARPRLLGQPLTSSSSVSVDAVAFSHDSRTLATGGNDGKIGLWDVANPAHPQRLGEPLTNSSVSINAVAFSPDADTLASGDLDGITQLWNLNVHDAIARICGTAGDLTLRQWRQYIPQPAYQPACAR